MAEVFFDNPPTLNGQEAEQLKQLYGYLHTLSDKLNTALMDISVEQLNPETRKIVTEAGGEAMQKQSETLKSLIIKTANIVRTEMDEIRTTLETRVEAISDQYGALESTLTNEIAVTAEGIRQNVTDIKTLQSYAAEDQAYRTMMNGYVNVGVVRYDSITQEPVLGIAIGENITKPDGTIDMDARLATFTVDRLSFYMGGNEVAYFANNIFHIAAGEITSTLKMGNHVWKKLQDNALALIAGS